MEVTMAKGDTTYSEKVKGDRGNFGWEVDFDFTDGYVGIDQFDENGKLKDRILLSPAQVSKLSRFVSEQKRS
jgi:hypothetical protein